MIPNIPFNKELWEDCVGAPFQGNGIYDDCETLRDAIVRAHLIRAMQNSPFPPITAEAVQKRIDELRAEEAPPDDPS